MSNQSIIIEFWEFLRIRKRYWLLPIVIVLLLLGGVIMFVETSAVAPFIYALLHLKVYADGAHPHSAQEPVEMAL